jgi:hypothetical protein
MHESATLNDIFSQGEPKQSVTEKHFRWVKRDQRRVCRGLDRSIQAPVFFKSLAQSQGGVNRAQTAIGLVGGTPPA